jgi:hypothetical protein
MMQVHPSRIIILLSLFLLTDITLLAQQVE